MRSYNSVLTIFDNWSFIPVYGFSKVISPGLAMRF